MAIREAYMLVIGLVFSLRLIYSSPCDILRTLRIVYDLENHDLVLDEYIGAMDLLFFNW